MSVATTSAVPRAQRLALQGAVNRMIRGVLRTPVLCRLAGRRLVTIYVVGRKSGRRYNVPVAYTLYEGSLVVGTPFAWGRNLRRGEPVEIRLKGERRTADVEIFTDEAGVVDCYSIIARDNHQFARFNKIRIDDAGEPDSEDMHLAWARGARAFRLTPRPA